MEVHSTKLFVPHSQCAMVHTNISLFFLLIILEGLLVV